MGDISSIYKGASLVLETTAMVYKSRMYNRWGSKPRVYVICFWIKKFPSQPGGPHSDKTDTQLPVSSDLQEEVHRRIKTTGALQVFIEKKKPLACLTCGKRYHNAKCLENHIDAHVPADSPIP
jgi:hypothetical protein